jgi:hypothetical protein
VQVAPCCWSFITTIASGPYFCWKFFISAAGGDIPQADKEYPQQ